MNKNEIQGKIIIVPLNKLPAYLKNKNYQPAEYLEDEEILIVKPIEKDAILTLSRKAESRVTK